MGGYYEIIPHLSEEDCLYSRQEKLVFIFFLPLLSFPFGFRDFAFFFVPHTGRSYNTVLDQC